MVISRIKLKNWKNFRNVDVELRERMFLFGPNGCGKSNLLDVFRFMRDIVKSGGGLQKALQDRGGLKKIRCFYAGRHTGVELEFHFSQSFEKEKNPGWIYRIGVEYEGKGSQRTLISKEEVRKDEVPGLLQRKSEYGMKIFPLIVKPCAWTEVQWLSAMEVRPQDGKPLSKFREDGAR
jgi:predicted ATPase